MLTGSWAQRLVVGPLGAEQRAQAGGAGQAGMIKDLISHAQVWVKPW